MHVTGHLMQAVYDLMSHEYMFLMQAAWHHVTWPCLSWCKAVWPHV